MYVGRGVEVSYGLGLGSEVAVTTIICGIAVGGSGIGSDCPHAIVSMTIDRIAMSPSRSSIGTPLRQEIVAACRSDPQSLRATRGRNGP